MYFDEKNNYFEIEKEEKNINIDKFLDNTEYKINNYDIENVIFNRHKDTTIDPIEGFNRGNMFENLYSPYKNYVYKLKVNNKKDELLYKIQIYYFAMIDLNLYLDLHPTETEALRNYQEYKKELERLKEEYGRLYGPLTIDDVNSKTKWTWIDNPWPWDKGGKN